MPSLILIEKFNNVASASNVFKLMSEADQALLLAGFQTASDEQLAEAIQAIETEDQKLSVSEQAQLNQAQNQIELAEQLHAEIKKADKQLLISEEQNEQASNIDALASMEEQLNSSAKPDSKSKKFLGLF